jgi:hypothetical protein
MCNTKNPRGRPHKHAKRCVSISLRLTWPEYKKLQGLAPRGKVSDYIRKVLFKQTYHGGQVGALTTPLSRFMRLRFKCKDPGEKTFYNMF